MDIRPPLNWGRTLPSGGLNVPNTYHNREIGVPHFLCDDIDTAYLQGEIDNDCKLKQI